MTTRRNFVKMAGAAGLIVAVTPLPPSIGSI
ncbi:MAG: twin-arginine translocation signal domain-containing protein [Acidobacteriaceae bacterium]